MNILELVEHENLGAMQKSLDDILYSFGQNNHCSIQER